MKLIKRKDKTLIKNTVAKNKEAKMNSTVKVDPKPDE
jgi:hypothetical protein